MNIILLQLDETSFQKSGILSMKNVIKKVKIKVDGMASSAFDGMEVHQGSMLSAQHGAVLSLAGMLLAIYSVVGVSASSLPTENGAERGESAANLEWLRNSASSNRPFMVNDYPSNNSIRTLCPDFNISHHDKLVAVACISLMNTFDSSSLIVPVDRLGDDSYISELKSRNLRVGVDLVMIDPVALGDVSIFANQGIFHPTLEWPWLIGVGGGDSGDGSSSSSSEKLFSTIHHRFAVLWALKEAFVKALCGNALADDALDLTKVVFTIRNDDLNSKDAIPPIETPSSKRAERVLVNVDLSLLAHAHASDGNYFNGTSSDNYSFTCHAWINNDKGYVIASCLISPTSNTPSRSISSTPCIQDLKIQDLLDFFL